MTSVATRLKEKWGRSLESDISGDPVMVAVPSEAGRILEFVNKDPALSMEVLSDMTCIDFLNVRDERYEVVYHLYSLSKNHRLRLKFRLPALEPRLVTVSDRWASALWLEREIFDLYGIVFEGHRDLRRVFSSENSSEHPLLKDYPLQD